MDSSETLNNLLSDTDLGEGKELLSEARALSARETHLLEWGKLKIGANLAFVQHPSIKGTCFPLAYFRRLEDPDPEKIAEIHKLAWNMGQAPLLFVVLPGWVQVYSTYERPRKKKTGKLDDRAGLIDTIDFLGTVERLRQDLAKYKREELLSGRFWERNKQRFKPRFRVEKTLLVNLSAIRNILISDEGLNAQFVHRLLGRSIFVQYLQDRKDPSGRNAFPEGFFDDFRGGAKSFTDVLAGKKATYRLFEFLEEKFNGDVFPVEPKEKRAVTRRHLTLLSDFLKGNIKLPSRQLAFWPYYSFDAIPIEFISNLYEEFFHFEKEELTKKDGNLKKHKAGTYYTRHRLVEFLMDEVFPWDGENSDVRIFDPACGSGIFLVEGYRRRIARWQRGNPGQRLSPSVLKDLLTKNIYGVDSNPEAVQVAAFSLYLTMCDYLEPRYIWKRVNFPLLRDKNLWVRDFFEFVEQPPSETGKFDLVIGNPPWESQLSPAAAKYVANHSRPIGDKQIAQAFLWAAPDICKETGEIVLVSPSKGLLFNMSEPNRAFRKDFFSSFEVKTIINFSALRHTLFPKATGPAAPVFYRPSPPSESRQILFCSPKPCYSPEDNWHYIIEPQDIAYVPAKQAAENRHIWKAATWGTPRDWELIQKLARLPSLSNVCKSRGWIDGEGFIVGNGKEEAAWLTNKPYVTPEAVSPFYIDEKRLPKLTEKRFERPRKGKSRQIYEGTHLLISQSPKTSRGFVAALLRKYAVFSQAIVGIHAPLSEEATLGAVCVAINSFVPVYYAMLTSGRWLVERDELAKDELMSLPIPPSISEGEMKVPYDSLQTIAFLDSVHHVPFRQEDISMYELTGDEMSLIRDAIEYTLDYFRRKESSAAVKYPAKDMLWAYGEAFCRILNESFGQSEGGFSATILTGDMPMIVAHITLNRGDRNPTATVVDAPARLTQAIKHVDQVLLEKGAGGVHVRRNVRIYDGSDVYLVKRNQSRFWTKSAAFRDADETYADIMRSWRG